MTSKTQLRKMIASLNQQLSNSAPTLSLIDRQAMIVKRETAYSAVKMLQAGQDVESFLNTHGVLTAETSGKGKSTWDTKGFTEYAKRGCATKQMPMSFRANRVGTARVVQANVASAGSRKRTASISSMTAHKALAKAKDVRIAMQMQGASSQGTRYTSAQVLKDGVKSTRITR